METNNIKSLLMTKLSAAIRNSGDDCYIASKLNDVLRRDGDYEGVSEAAVVEAMKTMTTEERCALLNTTGAAS